MWCGSIVIFLSYPQSHTVASCQFTWAFLGDLIIQPECIYFIMNGPSSDHDFILRGNIQWNDRTQNNSLDPWRHKKYLSLKEFGKRGKQENELVGWHIAFNQFKIQLLYQCKTLPLPHRSSRSKILCVIFVEVRNVGLLQNSRVSGAQTYGQHPNLRFGIIQLRLWSW